MTADNSVSDTALIRGGAWVGASVRRREDPRLLTGSGRFVDDMGMPGMLHAQFVRATIAAGDVTTLNLSEARGMPGVHAVWSASDLALQGLTARLDRPLTEFVPTEMPILSDRRIRFVGEPLAIAVADDAYLAEDAVEAIIVEYEPHRAITTIDGALRAGAPLVHSEAVGNVLVDVSLFATPGVDSAMREAAVVVRVRSKTGRQNALPLETRGALSYWDDRAEQLVIYTPTQVPHLVRSAAAKSLGLAERKVRVIVPDMGGGFGIKCVVGREELAVAAAAKRLRRPVKWIEDRRDALTASFLAREQAYDVRAAFDADGRILALDADIICDMGAYSCYPFTAGVEPLMASTEMPGVYRVPEYRVRGRAIASNKAPSAPYRGVSRPQIVMVMERLMERAARELNIDPIEIRRRNLITAFPYTGVNNITYDPGSYLESLNLCEQVLRDEGWFDLRDGSPERHIGIGFSCFSERSGYGSAAFAARKMDVVPGFDTSDITMDLDGTVSVTTGTLSHGQSHETTMAQIVADKLRLDISEVKIIQGDTDRITYGFGSFASRSIVIGGSAVALASVKLGEKLCEVAAHLLETHIDNVELGEAKVHRIDDPTVALSYA
ncbi:MAG: xanthine dehydrogenase family protein molybdopterin-binding subunit, partial [Mycobacterium sp.]